MGCDWPPGSARRWYWRLYGAAYDRLFGSPSHWVTTEFWDFGVPVSIPSAVPDAVAGSSAQPGVITDWPSVNDAAAPEAPAVETREFRAWAGRRSRDYLRQEVLEVCRTLSLRCEVRTHRGIFKGGLTFRVSGRPKELDEFADKYEALLETWLNELVRGQQNRT
jgi:hypothetical protein